MTNPEENETKGELQQHWIYVLGGSDLQSRASEWQQRKTAGGKLYALIEALPDERPDRRLTQVGNEDVLYVYARMWDGLEAVGESRKTPQELAFHLISEGLDTRHKELKIFASRSGNTLAGEGGSASYVERLYNCMKQDYPDITVYGYLGEVSPQGFDSHKTAGLVSGETPESLTRESWDNRKLRAKDNRVCFPPLPDGE
ncbi:hypothetical protein H7849_25350 [Alloacidobacterium dinghuense]|uniref:Uncharacterized protein n=1 Tax=Alloacidobacterium dinghuense TaxID=2763107 RepID=A0A7G8BIA1_9BACT|nr:hypothetical protein [Alloacidobacterium dinghuense]QNI32271.1 hypothetical protein H7849_25350 [Alloacidobacterium dinghuense]